MLRAAAALSLLAGAAGLLGFLHAIGKGPLALTAARHLRDMKDRDTAPERVRAFTFADFSALPDRRPAAEYSALESRGAVLEGHVQHLLRAPDGDIHLELVPRWRAPDAPDTAYITAEITPQWHRGSATWRHEALEAVFRPNHGGRTSWEGGARRVRLTGWLLYDAQHADHLTRWPMRRSAWEIHPVTRIEAWDDALGSFVEVGR